MLAIYLHANPFVNTTFSIWGLGLIVASLGIGAVVKVWASRRIQMALVLCALVTIFAANVVRVRTRAYPSFVSAPAYEVYCEGVWYWIDGCFLLP